MNSTCPPKLLRRCAATVFVCALLLFFPRTQKADAAAGLPLNEYSFVTAGDMRLFTGPGSNGLRYFDGACEAMAKIGAGDFLISPGDCDPPAPVRRDIDQYLGSNFIWYPVIGNHDAESPADMQWMRHWSDAGIPGLARHGPPGAEKTIYSFDHANSHFVVMNDYYDGSADTVGHGEVPSPFLEWLEADLKANEKPLVWVIGHKPIKAQPDMDTGRLRHADDPLTPNAAHLRRFLDLLNRYHVRAYLCGHTHDASITKAGGIWQADSGHARGAGDQGAPSTFLKFRVDGLRAWVDVYRADTNGVVYSLRKTTELN